MKKTIITLFLAASFIAGCGEDCSLIEQNILMTKNQIQLKKDELAKINNSEDWLKIKPEISKKEKETLELKKQVNKFKKEAHTISLKIIELSRKR